MKKKYVTPTAKIYSKIPARTAAALAQKSGRDAVKKTTPSVNEREKTKRYTAEQKYKTKRYHDSEVTKRKQIKSDLTIAKRDSKLQKAAGASMKTATAAGGTAQNIKAARGDSNLDEITAALVTADASSGNAGALQDDGDQGKGTNGATTPGSNDYYPGSTNPDGKSKGSLSSTSKTVYDGLVI